ncbi:winged helix-turn-helix transcriptional regulator, partial [Nocardia cyriacigeorgica]|uniref:winged helix-turn-helix transcriptional regulator n=1 Tax=Nocardia cyriacigeorgica TaxID=135487 RepID=UPI0028121B72
MDQRTYNQYCATARTLDLVGERWTLLLIRELLTGPKRFGDLQASLRGLGTGLLSAQPSTRTMWSTTSGRTSAASRTTSP